MGHWMNARQGIMANHRKTHAMPGWMLKFPFEAMRPENLARGTVYIRRSNSRVYGFNSRPAGIKYSVIHPPFLLIQLTNTICARDIRPKSIGVWVAVNENKLITSNLSTA